MTDAFKLWWEWRSTANRPFLRSFLLIAVALIFTSATIAASVLSSQIVSRGTIDVLVDSPLCGGFGNDSDAFVSQVAMIAPSYVETCYPDETPRARCQMFMEPNIPLIVRDEPCPFNETKWCNTTDALGVDTDLLDIGKTFGLNLKAKDRTQFRRKTTCTVLPIEGAYTVVNTSDYPRLRSATRTPIGDEQLLALFYGPTFANLFIAPMTTYMYSLLMSNVTGQTTTFRWVVNNYTCWARLIYGI